MPVGGAHPTGLNGSVEMELAGWRGGEEDNEGRSPRPSSCRAPSIRHSRKGTSMVHSRLKFDRLPIPPYVWRQPGVVHKSSP